MHVIKQDSHDVNMHTEGTNKENRARNMSKIMVFLTWPDGIENSAHVGVASIRVVEAVVSLVGARALGH